MTAISAIKSQPISPKTLVDLLGQDAGDEQLGTGVAVALADLDWCREFYALPEWVEPGLERFAAHLNEALAVLAQLREEAQIAADM